MDLAPFGFQPDRGNTALGRYLHHTATFASLNLTARAMKKTTCSAQRWWYPNWREWKHQTWSLTWFTWKSAPGDSEIPNLETIIFRFHVKLQGCTFVILIFFIVKDCRFAHCTCEIWKCFAMFLICRVWLIPLLHGWQNKTKNVDNPKLQNKNV